MIYPLKNYLSLKRGYRFGQPTSYSNFHLGVDLIDEEGTPVYAPCNGLILKKLEGSQGGKTIHFKDNDQGRFWRFMHLKAFSDFSRYVKEGTIIGFVGRTGSLAGKTFHLHLDISKNGKLELNNLANFIDPQKYLADNVGKKNMDTFTLEEVTRAFYKAYRGSDIDPEGWENLQREFEKLKNSGDKNFALTEILGGKFRDYNFYTDLFRYHLNK